MKNTPIIIHVTTLSDLATQRDAGLVRGLYASCDNQHCHRVYTPIDLDAMISEYGGACDWKTLKPVCVECDKMQRDYRAASLHIDWCDTSQVKGYRLEEGGSMIGHNRPPKEPVKLIKKRRRSTAGLNSGRRN